MEFEGQLSLADINSLTKKELYYLRKEREAYHIRVKEETDAALANAEAEKAEKQKTNQYNQPQRRKPPNKTRHRSRH